METKEQRLVRLVEKYDIKSKSDFINKINEVKEMYADFDINGDGVIDAKDITIIKNYCEPIFKIKLLKENGFDTYEKAKKAIVSLLKLKLDDSDSDFDEYAYFDLTNNGTIDSADSLKMYGYKFMFE